MASSIYLLYGAKLRYNSVSQYRISYRIHTLFPLLLNCTPDRWTNLILPASRNFTSIFNRNWFDSCRFYYFTRWMALLYLLLLGYSPPFSYPLYRSKFFTYVMLGNELTIGVAFTVHLFRINHLSLSQRSLSSFKHPWQSLTWSVVAWLIPLAVLEEGD